MFFLLLYIFIKACVEQELNLGDFGIIDYLMHFNSLD